MKKFVKFIEDKDLSDKFDVIYLKAQRRLCYIYQKTKNYKEFSVLLENLIKQAKNKKKLHHNDYFILYLTI